MKTVRDAYGALSVKLSDQIEQLDELIHVEGDGSAFFEKTHITHGMQDLISEGIARLAGGVHARRPPPQAGDGRLRPEEASAARVLRELIKNQRLG